MGISLSTRCSVILLLFAVSCSLPAFASGGEFLFDNLHWSPDGRFLSFVYRFLVADDGGGRTPGFLGFYDVKRELVWSPHEGKTLYVPEFDTHYVANRFGIFAVRPGGGPWRLLTTTGTYAGGGPLHYDEAVRLRYDADQQSLLCFFFANENLSLDGQDKAQFVQVHLPEGKVQSFACATYGSEEGARRIGQLIEQYELKSSTSWYTYPPTFPPGLRPQRSGVSLSDLSPFLFMALLNDDVYWRAPHTLVFFNLAYTNPYTGHSADQEAYSPVQAYQVNPLGLAKPFHGAGNSEGLVRDYSPNVWKTPRTDVVRYRIRLDFPEDWKLYEPWIVALDQDGNFDHMLEHAATCIGPDPMMCRGNYQHGEGKPGPGERVLIFPLYAPETDDCDWFSDLDGASQIFFKSEAEATAFARDLLPSLRQWFAEKSENNVVSPEKLNLVIEPERIGAATGITYRGNHQYFVLYDRLWHMDLDTDEIDLVHAKPMNHYAVSPDGRYIAASITQGYCSKQLLLYDLETNVVKRILPPR